MLVETRRPCRVRGRGAEKNPAFGMFIGTARGGGSRGSGWGRTRFLFNLVRLGSTGQRCRRRIARPYASRIRCRAAQTVDCTRAYGKCDVNAVLSPPSRPVPARLVPARPPNTISDTAKFSTLVPMHGLTHTATGGAVCPGET